MQVSKFSDTWRCLPSIYRRLSNLHSHTVCTRVSILYTLDKNRPFKILVCFVLLCIVKSFLRYWYSLLSYRAHITVLAVSVWRTWRLPFLPNVQFKIQLWTGSILLSCPLEDLSAIWFKGIFCELHIPSKTCLTVNNLREFPLKERTASVFLKPGRASVGKGEARM